MEEVTYVIVNNIPKIYHSSDLRNFFSTLLETSGFSCFHFRHRPEVQKPSATEISCSSQSETDLSRCVTTCCVIKVYTDRINDFIQMYDKKHWVDREGHSMTSCCFIKQIAIVDETEINVADVSNWKSEQSRGDREVFIKSDLSSLIELQPPVFMPNGNVGTPTSYFLKEIKLCRLPPLIIKKLGLEFPLSKGRRLYGCVGYDYGGKRYAYRKASPSDDDFIRTSRGAVLSRNYVKEVEEDEDTNEDEQEDEEEKEYSEEEEWDRHECLHEDVTTQGRTKERLFEEKIELKWEKGGSGLVFYTDAQIWDEKEGDFDAKTADDWDVDMSGYYEPGLGDKDARDLLKMRLEKRLRQGVFNEKTDVRDFAGFEKHSTGFGRRVLEAQGWKQGQGIGKTIIGMSEPILDAGKHPRDKKGFGYRGEKLNRKPVPVNKRRRQPYSCDFDDRIRISTIYDNPSDNDKQEPLLRSNFHTHLKYRKEFLQQKSNPKHS